MKNLFDLDNPFMRILFVAGNLMLANLLFLIFSLPVITIGVSWTAMQKTIQEIMMDRFANVFRIFFHAIKCNFKKATLVWIVELAVVALFTMITMIVLPYFTGTLFVACKYFLGISTVLLIAFFSYLYPIMARYENTLRCHIKNSIILIIGKLPQTLLLIAVNAVPFLMLLFPVKFIVRTLIYWVLIGFGLISYISNLLIRPIFLELERADEPKGKRVEEI